MKHPVIVLFRRDLRTADNPALSEAAKTGAPLICLYVEEDKAARALGGASKWWLHHSLTALDADLKALGSRLCVKRGDAADIILKLVTAHSASHVFWNRRYGKDGIERDKALKTALQEQGVAAESFKANLLTEPWTVKTGGGDYYKVFTPYWKTVRNTWQPQPPLPAPTSLVPFEANVSGIEIADLDLLPTAPDWGSKMAPHWSPGSAGAKRALEEFLDGPVDTYKTDRDRPDRRGTSRLSPHLAFGEISPLQIWDRTQARTENGDKFLSEIGWREFSYTLLFYNPDLATENFKSDFDAFEWSGSDSALKRWQEGQTGYPFVDAGMRELWATGWQHNRVRMVTASFLIKHLLIDWRAGEDWFWDTLLDADPASNAAGWQWVAGSGADASPYFRIFNPITQGQKFDPKGDYVRKWVPELRKLPDKYIHCPWDAPKDVLKTAGVSLGSTYPSPIVEHKIARERALAAYQATRN